jgi:hypothetical protein
VSSKPPVTASVPATWTAEPTQPFTTLKDAIAKANPNIVYAHVAFPRQHTPLPIECTVDAHRFEDLDRVHTVLSSLVNKESAFRHDVTRSLSCVVEHNIAVAAKLAAMSSAESSAESPPQPCVGDFIGREMKGCGGALPSARAIEELKSIVTGWSTKIDAVKAELPKQNNTAAQAETEMKDAQSTTTSDTALNTAVDVTQDIDMDAIGGTPVMLTMSANTNAPAIPTAHNTSTYDEDMSTAEELALHLITSPFPPSQLCRRRNPPGECDHICSHSQGQEPDVLMETLPSS